MTIDQFQDLIRETYQERDEARGLGGDFMWFMEEVGELATAIREDDRESLAGEFADVFAWLATMANLTGIRLSEAVKKYSNGCPACHKMPCECPAHRADRD